MSADQPRNPWPNIVAGAREGRYEILRCSIIGYTSDETPPAWVKPYLHDFYRNPPKPWNTTTSADWSDIAIIGSEFLLLHEDGLTLFAQRRLVPRTDGDRATLGELPIGAHYQLLRNGKPAGKTLVRDAKPLTKAQYNKRVVYRCTPLPPRSITMTQASLLDDVPECTITVKTRRRVKPRRAKAPPT